MAAAVPAPTPAPAPAHARDADDKQTQPVAVVQPSRPTAKQPAVRPTAKAASPAPVKTAVAEWVEKVADDLRAREAAARAAWEEGIRDAKALAVVKREAFEKLRAEKAPFSKQKQAREAAVAAVAQLHKRQAAPPTPPQPVVKTLNLLDVREGMVGKLKLQQVEVLQVVGPNDFIAFVDVLGTPNDKYVWVQKSTRGLANKDTVRLTGLVEGVGTKTYKTAIGGANTVHAVRIHDDVAIPAAQPIPPQPAEPFAELPPARREPVVMPPGRAGDWKQVGQVKVRVASVAYAPPPLVDRNGDAQAGAAKAALVWVEVRNESPQPRTYRRYQQGSICNLLDRARVSHPAPVFPAGQQLDDATPLSQVIPAGGSVVHLVVFQRAAAPAEELTLVLDAARVGEAGEFSLRIPAAAWSR